MGKLEIEHRVAEHIRRAVEAAAARCIEELNAEGHSFPLDDDSIFEWIDYDSNRVLAIHSDHQVVQSGPYRFVRHPSYTGLLVAFIGFGLIFANRLRLLALLVPITLGMLYRVTHEEEALLRSLGPAHASYRNRTKRFIPWVV